MDLNYLFLRQQMERTFAEAADNEAARVVHEEMARAYERAIEHESDGRIMFPRNPSNDARAKLPFQKGQSL